LFDNSHRRYFTSAPSLPFVRVLQIAVTAKLTLACATAEAKKAKATKRAAQCAVASALALKKRRESEPPLLPPRRGHARRHSASAALARPARVRDAPDIFTYKHHEPLLRPPPPVATGPEMCTLGIFDQGLLAEQLVGCQKKKGVALVCSTPRGLGAGTLDFACVECGTPWKLDRSRNLPKTGPGAPLAQNMQLLTSACDVAGVGHSQAQAIFVGADLDFGSKDAWYCGVARHQAGSTAALRSVIEANRKKEEAATLL